MCKKTHIHQLTDVRGGLVTCECGRVCGDVSTNTRVHPLDSTVRSKQAREYFSCCSLLGLVCISIRVFHIN